MAPAPCEIYDALVPYRDCKDPRPVIVLEPPSGGKVVVALISGAMDLLRGSSVHFKLDPTHPDFVATGLKKECYVAGDEIFTLPVAKLMRRRGRLLGELASRFQSWI